MKFYFENIGELSRGVAEVAPELGIELVALEDAEYVIAVEKTDERMLRVTMEEGRATIVYGDGYARFFRALAMLADAIRRCEDALDVTERPLFATNGAMVDMSRNAVMTVDATKAMMRKMALMGMNTYMLYTEDTYELDGYPYFGYMRGRYTKDELRTLDAYALSLGIELIPCIQVLGHMTTHLRWSAAAAYRDTATALLVGADATYDLIERIMQTLSECFTTRRVHIGMDETHDLGRGASIDRFGYSDPQQLYFTHLERVSEIVAKHGFEPIMWSDMFFRLAGKDIPGYEDYCMAVTFTEEFVNSVPKHIKQVYWDYYHDEESFYATNIDKHHLLFGENMMFAGGVWLWSGHCPLFSESLRNTVPALEACRKKGVRDVLATVWLNGGEGMAMLSLAGLAWYADYDYKGTFDIESVKRCFEFGCLASYDDVIKCELPEHPHGDRFSVTRALLYNDPLLGMMDKHFEGLNLRSYYKRVTKELDADVMDTGIFTVDAEVVRRLSSLLENKADFGIRLKAAYDAGKCDTLAAMRDECDVIIEKINALRVAHRASWMTSYKPFGWEVHDLRYGGLINRFDTVKERLGAYLGGEIEHIEELEAERLRFDGKGDGAARIDDMFFWNSYQSMFCASKI